MAIFIDNRGLDSATARFNFSEQERLAWRWRGRCLRLTVWLSAFLIFAIWMAFALWEMHP